MLRTLILLALCGFYLSGCATAKRGAKQDFVITTNPAGARVDTTLQEGRPIGLTKSQFRAIQSGGKPPPELSFKYCEPTPCTLTLPRKIDFDILITKEGYVAQTHRIDHFHHKEIAAEVKKEVGRNVAIAGTAGAVAGAGTVALGVQAISLGTASATTGAMATGAIVVAAPIIGVGLISMGVDSATGANYDYWPNPAAAELLPLTENSQAKVGTVAQDFYEMRRDTILSPPLSAVQARDAKAQREAERKARLRDGRLFKDYVANRPPESPVKP